MVQLSASQPLLIDTDVLIDYLRGQTDAVSFIESLPNPLSVSTITLAELYSGVREGEERKVLNGFVSAFEVVVVDAEIAVNGGLYRRHFGKSHGVGLADAIIAATAESRGATLVTLNVKHFPMLDSATVPYKKS